MSMHPSDVAWLFVFGGVVGYNLSAKDTEMLSEACDRYMMSHPWLTRAVVAAVALHLTNSLPPQLDAIHGLFQVKKLLR